MPSIIGHAKIVELLGQAVGRGRVPQTLLLAGPHGVGKRTVALALAQAVNCASPQRGVACGTCSTCLRIARGQFSDVVTLDKGDEASIKIKPVRERVLDLVGYRPFEGRRRVFIIDPADDLTYEAQDALLKTLEEPPPSAMLMLISSYPDTLRPTVQSRCRRLRFGPLADEDVVRVLVERCGMATGDAEERAAVAGGSVGRALEIDGAFLSDDRAAAIALIESAAGRNIAATLKVAAALAKHETKRRDREALSMRLEHVSSLLRDLGALVTGAKATLANADLGGRLARVASAFPATRLVDAFSLVARAQSTLDRSASPKIVADWVAVGLSSHHAR